MPSTFYITTPIYYMNDIPHIGHAYTTIAADVLARYNRLIGRETFYLTGLDEHGQKVQQAATKAGIDPKTHCDNLAPQFINLWKHIHIENDAFIRTTDSGHQTVVQRHLQSLYDRNLIYRADYTGWYCTFDERFWTEKDVENGLCPDCNRSVERLSESNYFFRMSQYQDALKDYIQNHPDFIKPTSRCNEVLGFLQKPLEDLSISRPKSRLSWGIELPFDTNYVTYVWFDALMNYVSALEYLTPKPAFQQFWPASLHLVGKDILTTHAVYWSTILMALEFLLPQTIFAHGWWTVNGEKMSKSRGNVVDPQTVVNQFGSDAFRYFLLREIPFGQDGDYSQEALVSRLNSDLANGLGNLLSRTVMLIQRFSKGVIPTLNPETETDLDMELKSTGEQLLKEKLPYHLSPDRLDFHRALESIWGLVQLGNQYIDKTAPWVLGKSAENQPRLDTVLFNSAETLHYLCLALYPFIPEAAKEIGHQIGLTANFSDPLLSKHLTWEMLVPGNQVVKGKALFPRVDEKGQSKIPATDSKSGEKEKSLTEGTSADTQELISIDEFQKIELKVARILKAERVPRSEKLVKLQVDLGTEQRQIVAGIGKKYEPEQLVGQTIVVVANLKPAKLMGIESQGMVLAAGTKEVQGLLTLAEEVEPGIKVR